MSTSIAPGLPAPVKSSMSALSKSQIHSNATQLAEKPDGGASESFVPNPDDDFDVYSLVMLAREGDRGSLGELLAHYRNYLLVLASAQLEKRLAPRLSPSDIVQETMLKAQHHFGQFRGQTEKELVAWLRQILATRLARFIEQHLLAAKRDIRREVSLQQCGVGTESSAPRLDSIVRAAVQSPSAEVRQREDAVVLDDLLARLPGRYRDVLILRNAQGLSFDEIATRLNRTPGAARMLWLRAIEKLRAINRKENLYDP